MLLSRSSSSFTTVLAMIVLSILAMLATTPMTAEAGCTYECAGISAKILVCGNVLRDGITDELPTIGIDSSVDNCLCNQDNVRLLRNCQACKDLNNAVNKTNKFISDCKILNQSRNLVNSSGASRFGFLASGAVYVALAVASAGLAAAL
ncbi:hypothetical protein BG000_001956 [Podila horticola]|nr:hypothetical protein BG000_001956 [Podila horticola]